MSRSHLARCLQPSCKMPVKTHTFFGSFWTTKTSSVTVGSIDRPVWHHKGRMNVSDMLVKRFTAFLTKFIVTLLCIWCQWTLSNPDPLTPWSLTFDLQQNEDICRQYERVLFCSDLTDEPVENKRLLQLRLCLLFFVIIFCCVVVMKETQLTRFYVVFTRQLHITRVRTWSSTRLCRSVEVFV